MSSPAAESCAGRFPALVAADDVRELLHEEPNTSRSPGRTEYRPANDGAQLLTDNPIVPLLDQECKHSLEAISLG